MAGVRGAPAADPGSDPRWLARDGGGGGFLSGGAGVTVASEGGGGFLSDGGRGDGGQGGWRRVPFRRG